MNNSILVFSVMGLISGSFLTGCEKTAEQRLEGAKQNVQKATQELKGDKTAFLEEWQRFKTESEQTLQANQKRIDAFKEKMDKAGSKVKAKYSKDVAALEQNNRDLKKKLDDYKDEGEGKWVEFKTNFKHDMDGIGKTMTDLFKDTD
jgi:exonuclease VII large subunit